MRMTALALLTLIVLIQCLPMSRAISSPPATQPATPEFDVIAKELGIDGTLADDVYTVTLTRSDLDVLHEDGPVPAGVLRTEFQFYRCDCGKMNVIGQFTVADYEANDVIDALRAGMIKVASVSPMLMNEHPRLLIVRFHGGGGSQHLAKTLSSALEWTGEARMAPATRPVR
ncbi:MAG TPA: DUF1259 domain-containing protein [Tepidisphaeraceae bacterium]|nr:DUF1259 domain-containing protein [Tepidisphaeraceae bacterium]